MRKVGGSCGVRLLGKAGIESVDVDARWGVNMVLKSLILMVGMGFCVFIEQIGLTLSLLGSWIL